MLSGDNVEILIFVDFHVKIIVKDIECCLIGLPNACSSYYDAHDLSKLSPYQVHVASYLSNPIFVSHYKYIIYLQVFLITILTLIIIFSTLVTV